MVGHVKQWTLCLALAGLSPWSWALGPTAPFVAPTPGQFGALGQSLGSAASAAPATQGLSGVRLGRRSGAVIDGQWVRKGHSIRGARLVDVQRTRVTLLHPDGRKEVIEMYPSSGGQAAAKASAPTEAIKP
ncbi:MAG: hypothetical protein KGN37_00780 [Burkholderiales bacterium]|nr:hypothetical protein [Burkholderiales bacterium]